MATLRKLPTMVAVAAFTAALSGCGGNDGKLVRDLEADVEAAVARATAAEAAKALAEMAQAEAETAATMASSARMTAEQERDTATAAQMMAEEARTAAEMRQSEAEMAQAMAEEAQAEAEMAQAEAEMARETARTAQAAAEAAQAAAQAAAMEARADEEDARAAERAARMAETAALTRAAAAEAKSTADEAARMAAETAQAEAEMAQMAAETARMAAEADKKAAETAQAAAETARKAAEAEKMAAETAQAAAETARMAAEAAQKTAEEDLRKANEEIARLMADLDRDRDAETASRVAAAINNNRVGRVHLGRIDSAGHRVDDIDVDAVRGLAVIGSDRAPASQDQGVSAGVPNEGSFISSTGALPVPYDSEGGNSQLPFLSWDDDIENNRGHLTTVSASRVANSLPNVSVSLPTLVGVPKYVQQSTAEASADGVWNSATLTRSTPATLRGGEETIMVYTDITPPKVTSFVFDSPDLSGEIGSYAAGTMASVSVKTPPGRIVLDTPPQPNTILRYGGTGAVLPGTYGTVRGRYVCPGLCEFKASPSGVVTLVDPEKTPLNPNDNNDNRARSETGFKNEVYFRPDAASSYLASDLSYTYFGWWMLEPNEGGVYRVEGFSGRNDLKTTKASPHVSEVRLTPDLAGKATYSGLAAGRYATRSIPIRGQITDGEEGSFTADAMLSADFGTDTSGNLGSITGDLMNFDMSGDTDATGWVLSLGNARLSSSTSSADHTAEVRVLEEREKKFGSRTTVIDTSVPSNQRLFPVAQRPKDGSAARIHVDAAGVNRYNFTGATSLNRTSDQFTATSGRWEGRFFDLADTKSGAPHTVIGTFDSRDNLVYVTGAFGAKKQ